MTKPVLRHNYWPPPTTAEDAYGRFVHHAQECHWCREAGGEAAPSHRLCYAGLALLQTRERVLAAHHAAEAAERRIMS